MSFPPNNAINDIKTGARIHQRATHDAECGRVEEATLIDLAVAWIIIEHMRWVRLGLQCLEADNGLEFLRDYYNENPQPT